MGGVTSPPSTSTLTELWNGTSWTASENMATAHNFAASGGTQAATFVAGAPGTATEEFTGAFNATRTVTTS